MDPNAVWYGPRRGLAQALRPLSWLYCGVVTARNQAYRRGWLSERRLPVPVIVVGNLTVGGTGKTPLALQLAIELRARGWRPALLVRGHGGRARAWPQVVHPDSDPDQVGDEAVLLARRSGGPVAAGPDRVAAGRLALAAGDCDLLLTDDGLQHRRLARDLEIVVIDGERGFGNGYCLPAGPLREPLSMLAPEAVRIWHGGTQPGHRMRLVSEWAVNLADPRRRRPLEAFRGERVRAVAGIGHPERFFRSLRDRGLTIDPLPYPDHHRFTADEIAGWSGTVLMTEKDAVKCESRARSDHWAVPVTAEVDGAFLTELSTRLTEII